ncbi:hypothetical protein RhiirC2_797626 [Rhizophagus irregularis]|uniref:Uncharacterized protein n=1 Tax=Rhizophagus irregularis TaxID=588596 RepID=A0A2N1M7Q3_9GLOM|nr:hypothetical protein RhiirC2_797626 [Rhizophagus irregularis]
MGCDPTTICRFIDKYKKTGKTENLPRSGWPSALNDNEKNALINEQELRNTTFRVFPAS